MLNKRRGSNSLFNVASADFLTRIKSGYPELVFRTGKRFAFRPPKTVILGPDEPFYELFVLHEVSHAILKHRDFKTDVDRIKMETDAWEQAKKLAQSYDIEINEELIQAELDTYRDWLHKKSRCPKCGLTRFQTPDGNYHCPRCENFC